MKAWGIVVLVVGLVSVGSLTAVAAADGAVTVASEAQLRSAFAEAQVTAISLAADVALTDCSPGYIGRSSATPLVVEGNGHVVHQTCERQGVFVQWGAGPLTFDAITIRGGQAWGTREAYGGGIRAGGDVTITSSHVVDNRVMTQGDKGTDGSGGVAAGGGLYALGNVTITNSSFEENGVINRNGEALQQFAFGGAVAAGGSITVTGSTVSSNLVVGEIGFGGGLHAVGSIVIDRSVVDSNRALGVSSSTGGGVNANERVEVTGSSFVGNKVESDNRAAESGGGISADEVTVTSSTVTGNSAAHGGGMSGDEVTVTSSTVTGNDAAESGGGISGHEVTVTSSTVTDNDAAKSGGGISGVAPETAIGNMVTVTSSTVTGNSAAHGGGISGDEVTVTSSTLTGNQATASGGAISGDEVTVTSSTLTANQATASGGGITARSLTLVYATVNGNRAPSGANLAHGSGGGLALDSFGSIIASPLGGGRNCLLDSEPAPPQIFYPNVVDDGSCFFIPEPTPLLGPLADHGGPTATQLPLPGSTALNRVPAELCQYGPATGVTTDQRGLPRPSPGQACDAGAVQLQDSEGRPPGLTPPTGTAPGPSPAALVPRFTG